MGEIVHRSPQAMIATGTAGQTAEAFVEDGSIPVTSAIRRAWVLYVSSELRTSSTQGHCGFQPRGRGLYLHASGGCGSCVIALPDEKWIEAVKPWCLERRADGLPRVDRICQKKNRPVQGAKEVFIRA